MPGRDLKAKRAWCETHFASRLGSASFGKITLNAGQGKSFYFEITLAFADDHHAIINQSIETTAATDEQPAVVLQFQDYYTVKTPKSDEEFRNKCAFTIQVIDLPLNIKVHFVCVVFVKYGNIVSIQIRTCGYYQCSSTN